MPCPGGNGSLPSLGLDEGLGLRRIVLPQAAAILPA